MRSILGPWRLAALLLVVPAAWVYVWLLSPAQASPLGFVAGALACPAGVEGPDCSAENATDVSQVPVTNEGECGLVGQVLGTRLVLAPGQRLKITCERRKG